MSAYIDIITGFLESGKTTFIKELLNSSFVEEFNKIILLVCEEGFTEYDENQLNKRNITRVVLEKDTELNDDLFKEILNRYDPDYIVIEYNGTWDISRLLGLKLPYEYRFRNVIFISEAATFKSQLSNMAWIMQPHILNSNVVVFNRYDSINPEVKKKLIRDIKNINPRTKVTYIKELSKDNKLKERFLEFGNLENVSLNLKMNLKASIIMVLLLSVILVFVLPSVYSYAQSIVTIFLSILIQAIPFILLGAFISAGIQIFTNSGWIIKQISKGKAASFLIASMAGFFFPICDCGMIPIISGLLKKETPLPQTITFWLSSSAVSPIVIISMLYAFPEKPYLAAFRVVFGVVIGIIVGIIFKLIHLETKDVIRENRRLQSIGKDILDLKYEGLKGKVEAVFGGAKAEFFRVIEYVIIGAFISSVFQTLLPQTMKNYISDNFILQFVVMIIAAMVMSTCSTSNAFIGKSFSGSFSTLPILTFIVIGPMLDLKNIVMLSEVLKKRFLIFLMCLIIIISTIMFGGRALFW